MEDNFNNYKLPEDLSDGDNVDNQNPNGFNQQKSNQNFNRTKLPNDFETLPTQIKINRPLKGHWITTWVYIGLFIAFIISLGLMALLAYLSVALPFPTSYANYTTAYRNWATTTANLAQAAYAFIYITIILLIILEVVNVVLIIKSYDIKDLKGTTKIFTTVFTIGFFVPIFSIVGAIMYLSRIKMVSKMFDKKINEVCDQLLELKKELYSNDYYTDANNMKRNKDVILKEFWEKYHELQKINQDILTFNRKNYSSVE